MTPIENLQLLISAVEQHPEKSFNLSHYKKNYPCGTLFCTIGLAASMPEFQSQGLELIQRSGSTPFDSSFDVKINGKTVWCEGVADPLFGPGAFDRLFEPADCGSMDAFLGYRLCYEDTFAPNMTDKELALKRLNKQLSILKEEK